MRTDRLVQNWFSTLDPRLYALIVGALIGAVGGTLGLMIAVAGPLIAAAADRKSVV